MAARRPGQGRKPKPNNQKKLSGSRRVNQQAVEFDLITNVDPPEWLPELARGMWLTLCPQLCNSKVLSTTDIHNLEAFCSAYSRWRKAEEEIAKVGITIATVAGGFIKNPACTVANESLRQLQSFGASLGLDPASRGRLISPTSGKNSNPFNDF